MHLNKDDESDAEDEEDDMPEDLADLDPAEQQRQIKMRSLYKMSLGTLLVLVFSDPMVDIMGRMGVILNINSFYVSFVLAPIASNASELVAAYNYAKKRTTKSITTSLSTLIGAGIMNNTFCLGIFFALIFFKKLAWVFTAETTAIVLVEFCDRSLRLGTTEHEAVGCPYHSLFLPWLLGGRLVHGKCVEN